jgi:hypothetical protein
MLQTMKNTMSMPLNAHNFVGGLTQVGRASTITQTYLRDIRDPGKTGRVTF